MTFPFHQVRGLKWAEWASNPFGNTPPPPKKGPRAVARREGLAFQATLAAALSQIPALSGPWIRYEDRTGIHFAQPDFLLFPSGEEPVVLEAKLTFRAEAFLQLSLLYLPLLEALLSRKVLPVVACKNLGSFAGRPVSFSSLRSRRDLFPNAVLFWDAPARISLGD